MDEKYEAFFPYVVFQSQSGLPKDNRIHILV